MSHAIHLVVCDQDAEEFVPLRRGEIDAIIAEDTFAIGYAAANALLQHAEEGTALRSSVVEPILLTADNVADKAIQQRLRPYAGYDR